MNRLVVTAILLAAARAHAEPAELHAAATTNAEPVDVFATQPLAIIARGIEASYERRVLPAFSAVALGGVMSDAGGDMSSLTTMLGAELRWWPLRTMSRLYVGAHVGAARTSLSDAMGTVGASIGLEERLDVGWRFVIGSHVAITPSLGFGAREDIDESGRLATTARPAFGFGLELGWMR